MKCLIPYPNINTSPDLDYICWGPFNDLTTMCDLLTNPNQEDCSNAPATTQEVLQITNAVAGEFYVILVANWAASGSTPDPCFIQFTAAGPNDAFGGPNPGDAGADAGWGNPLLFCDTDPQMNLIDQLNGQPVNNGIWTYNGNSVPGTFDPAIDPPGIYTYSIAGSSSGTCPGDDAIVNLDVFSASSISITSPSVICSNENTFTLTGIPPAGWSTQGNGVFTDNTGGVITDFDPAISGIGNHNITYTYTPQGCNPIPVGGSILVNEAPDVLPSNVMTTNPSCFGFDDGMAKCKWTPSKGTPLVKDEDGEPATGQFSYSSVIGMLLYLSGHSRPDITYTMNCCARYMFNPRHSHEMALKWIGRYLKATRKRGLILNPSKDLYKVDDYPDADFADMYGYENPTDPSCVKNRTGYVITFADCPVLWQSKLQTETALSTMEAEIISLSHSCRVLFLICDMTQALGNAVGLPIRETTIKVSIHEDNAGALVLAQTLPRQFTPQSKYYAAKQSGFVRRYSSAESNC